MNHVWIILGASSAMGRATARALAKEGHSLILVGRNAADMRQSANDMVARGAAEAHGIGFDIRKPASFQPIYDLAASLPGTLNAAVFVGSMVDQADVDMAPEMGTAMHIDNFTGPAAFLQGLVPLMDARTGGTIVGVGSVAGDRGRGSNYSYGAAKAGFHTFLAGIRNRLTKSGGHVLIVKPGFVDTAMTWGLPGLFLVATPETVAEDILKAVKKERHTLYTPWFWRYIMLIIKSVPERIFKKLSI